MKKSRLFAILSLLILLGCSSVIIAQEQLGKSLKVKKVKECNVTPEKISALLDENEIEFHSIDEINWKEFPYKPEVKFRIAHTDDAIILNYVVKEESVRAKSDEDNKPVWADSCVEFFVSPTNDGPYYNIETNCIGTVLMEVGATRFDREFVPKESIARIKRWSSLGKEPFDERVGECSWELSLVVPYSVFTKSKLTPAIGMKMKANFYKCGDGLQTPHYLSWNKIDGKRPDFHRPDCFGTLVFE